MGSLEQGMESCFAEFVHPLVILGIPCGGKHGPGTNFSMPDLTAQIGSPGHEPTDDDGGR